MVNTNKNLAAKYAGQQIFELHESNMHKVKIINDEIHEWVAFRLGNLPGEDPMPETEDIIYNAWLRTHLGQWVRPRIHNIDMRTQFDNVRYETKAAIVGYMKPQDISFVALKFGADCCIIKQ